MREAIAITALLALLLPTTVVAQDEAPAVTVVPNDQFCNLVSDDVAGCEQVLTTLASAGILPEAFAGLVNVDAFTFRGNGSMNTVAFPLSGGEYYVSIDTTSNCDYSFLLESDEAGSRPSMSRTGHEWLGRGRGGMGGTVGQLRPGRYLWDVDTSEDKCEWEVMLTPQQ